MSLWSTIKIQESCNKPFLQDAICNPTYFEPNQNYKLILFYGRTGNFKSSTINMMMGVDLLESGIIENGVSKGVTICKKDNILIADTEGLNIDDISTDRHDILALFCLCHSFVIVFPIFFRFGIMDITRFIQDQLNPFKNIYKSKPNEINRPSLIILCPIANRIPKETVNVFKNKAQEYRNNLINNLNLRSYFSNIEIEVISPLTDNIHETIYESDKFRIAKVDNSNLREFQEVLYRIKNKNNPGQLGSRFKNLNIFYELSRQHQIIDSAVLDKSIEFIEMEIDNISSRWSIYDGDFNLYTNQIDNIYTQTIRNIRNLQLPNDIIDYYYIRGFDQEYEMFKKSKGDAFNEIIITLINSKYDDERIIIDDKIKSSKPMTYWDLDEQINESINKLKNIQYVNDALDQTKVFRIRQLINSKIESLSKNFESVFIEFKIIKLEKDQFFNENIDSIDVPTTLKDAKIEELKAILESKLSRAIQNFYHQTKLLFINRNNLIQQYSKIFKTECNSFYESKLKMNHEFINRIIEVESVSMKEMINKIELSTTCYDKRIIDEISKLTRESESRFLNFATKKYYDMYYEVFKTRVSLKNYDNIQDKVVRSCLLSIANT
jgi:hypothetical protein